MSTTTEVNAFEAEVREIVGSLQQSERDVIADWLSRQTRLETENWMGFSNCSVIVSWLLRHKFAITSQNLSTALTNCQANGKRRIFWKDTPKEDRAYVGGKPNHAHASNSEAAKPSSGEFYPDGRRNHSYAPPGAGTEKVEEPIDAWQQIIDMHMKEWTTHSQKAKLESELSAGRAAERSNREIAMSLGAIVRDQRRGR